MVIVLLYTIPISAKFRARFAVLCDIVLVYHNEYNKGI